jgi:hypothetical protein
LPQYLLKTQTDVAVRGVLALLATFAVGAMFLDVIATMRMMAFAGLMFLVDATGRTKGHAIGIFIK